MVNGTVTGQQQQPQDVVQIVITFDRNTKGINLQMGGDPNKIEVFGLLEMARLLVSNPPQQQDPTRIVPAHASLLNNIRRGVRPPG